MSERNHKRVPMLLATSRDFLIIGVFEKVADKCFCHGKSTCPYAIDSF